MNYKQIIEQIKAIAPDIDENKLYKVLDNYIIEFKDNPYDKANNFELLDMYIETKKLEKVSMGTISNYKKMLTKLFQEIEKPATRINIVDLRKYLANQKHWKSSTLATNLYAIRSFYRWMKEEDIIIKSEADKLKAPKQEKRKPKDMSQVELEQIRESCSNLRERSLIEMFLSTGSRLSEIARLDIGDIDFEKQKIKVFGKGKKERLVFLSDTAIYYLKKYIESRKDNINALFVTQKGKVTRLCNRSIQKIIEDIKKKSGVYVHCHKFRHTFASNLARKGVDLAIVKELMGHTSIDTTMIYATLKEEQLQYEHRRCA